jgi:hypothetical protein
MPNISDDDATTPQTRAERLRPDASPDASGSHADRFPLDASASTPQSLAQSPLEQAAELWGIEREFWDIWAKRHQTPPETERAVLKSVGVDTSTPGNIERAIADRLWREWSSPLAPTIVISDRPPIEIPIQIPADLASSIASVEIRFENGISTRFDLPLASSAAIRETKVRDRHFVRKHLRWPGELPLGYHNMTLRIGQQLSCDARLIVGPARAWQPEWLEQRRAAGIGVSLYALRSSRNWGCGDFTDLQALIDWAARDLSAAYIGLNPLHAIPNRQPFNTSPYLPNCSYYRNPIYLDVEKIDDFPRSPWAQRLLACERLRNEIGALRSVELVEYERVHRLKTRFLKILYRRFLLLEFPHDTARAREFRAYAEREGELLHRFAVHSALDEKFHKRDPNVWNWPSWPEPYRKPDSPATVEFAEKHWRSVLYHKYVQWQIDLQLEAAQKYARKRGLRIGLYHDLALATERFRRRIPNGTISTPTTYSPIPFARTASTAARSVSTTSCDSSASSGFPTEWTPPKAPMCANASKTFCASWRSKACATR